jgi:hypothetical protein
MSNAELSLLVLFGGAAVALLAGYYQIVRHEKKLKEKYKHS